VLVMRPYARYQWPFERGEGTTCAQQPPTGTKKAAVWRLGLLVARVEPEVGSFSDDGGVRKRGGAFGARPPARPGPLRSAAHRRR
jgi:hypothetical protein